MGKEGFRRKEAKIAKGLFYFVAMALPLLVLSRARAEAKDGGSGDFADPRVVSMKDGASVRIEDMAATGKNLLVTAEETIECRYVLPYYVVFEGGVIASGIPFSYKFRADLWGGCGERADQMYLYADSGTDYRPQWPEPQDYVSVVTNVKAIPLPGQTNPTVRLVDTNFPPLPDLTGSPGASYEVRFPGTTEYQTVKSLWEITNGANANAGNQFILLSHGWINRGEASFAGDQPETIKIGQPLTISLNLENRSTVPVTFTVGITIISPSGEVIQLPEQEVGLGTMKGEYPNIENDLQVVEFDFLPDELGYYSYRIEVSSNPEVRNPYLKGSFKVVKEPEQHQLYLPLIQRQ